MQSDNHIDSTFDQSDRAVQDGRHHQNFSSRGGALRGGRVGPSFPNRSHVPVHHDHPADPTYYSSGPPLLGHSPQAIDAYLSTLPVRGRYNHITCVSRMANGRHGEIKVSGDQHSTTADSSPCKLPELSDYYVDPDCLSTFRQLSDDATLIHAANAYIDKTMPKRKTKSQIDREAANAEREAFNRATYEAREAYRNVDVARKAIGTATNDADTALMILQYAENAAKDADDVLRAMKRKEINRKTAEFHQLVADAKQGPAERPRPIQIDATCSIGGGLPSDDGSSEEEEDEEEGDVVTDEEHDIAYADGLALKPTLLVPPKPNVTNEELSCFRTIADLSDRQSMEQKKARSRDLILRAELNRLKMKQIRARKKRSIKRTRKWVNLTPVVQSEPLHSTFEAPEPSIIEPNSPSIDTAEEKTPAKAIDSAPPTTSTPNRTRRVVCHMKNGTKIIQNTASPKSKPLPPPSPSSPPEINLSDFVEDELVCRFLRPWFEAHQATTSSINTSASDEAYAKQFLQFQAVVKFLDVVADSVKKVKDPLQIGCKKMDEVINPHDA